MSNMQFFNNLPITYSKLPIVHYLFLIAYCILPITINAQQISIDQAIQIALKNNLQMRASDLDIKATSALTKTVFELPKLDANFQFGQYNSIQTDKAIQLSQTIPFPTVFGAKSQLINSEVKAKEIQKIVSINELKNKVRTTYYQIEYLQFNHDKLKSLDSIYLEFIRVAQLRYKTGDTKKLEISTAESKRGEINLLLQQNDIQLQVVSRNLQILLNSNDKITIAKTSKYLPIQWTTLIDSQIVSNHPSILVLNQNIQISEQTKKLQRAENLPDIKLGYTNQSLIGFQNIDGQEQFFGAGNRFNVFSVGLAIPLTFGASSAKIKSLDFQKQSLASQAEFQTAILNSELQNSIGQYQQNIQQYYYYQQTALPNAREIVKSAQLGYKTGDISYVEYLYALQTATDIELKYLQSILLINQSVIQIYSLTNQ